MSTAVTPTPEQTAPLSQVQRIINVFFAPAKTFTDLNRSSNWILAWLLMSAFSIAYTTTVGSKIGFDKVSQNNMRMASASQQARIEGLPPEQRARVAGQQVAVTKGISYGFSVVNLIFMAIVALVLWGTFSFGMGAEVGYGKSLAVVVFASLPGIVKALLGIIVIVAGMDPDLFMIQNPVGTNIGYYLNFAETPRFLFSMATSFDLITIWMLILTGIGFSCVTKVKRGTAMMVVFGWFIVVSLCGAAIAAAFA